MREKETDVVVAGSGPGGATVARQLARAGRQVLLLERGRDWREHPLYGTYPGALLYTDKHALLFTKEGLNIIRPLMVGGATSMYAGCASAPLPWWRTRYGIGLEAYAAETATELGMAWQPQEKFMSPAGDFDCGAHCLLGCRCGAKWNAADYVDEAVAAGAELWTRAIAEQVLITGAGAEGVRGRVAGEPFTVRANTVVVAAGGIGSAVLLRLCWLLYSSTPN